MTAVAAAASPAIRMTADDAARLTARVTTVSVVAGLSLTIMKVLAWRVSGSVSLLSSAADSGLDFVAAMATFWAVRYAVAPPDAEHRFGHGKAEAFASLLQAGLVFASAALIGREAISHLLKPEPVRAEGWGLAVMVVSIVATSALISYQGWVVRRTRSVAVAGDRAHYAADLVSNVAAIAAIGLSRLTGETRWDAAGGLLVAVWLVWGAVSVLRQASQQLMDREIDDAERADILRLAQDDARVLGVHQFRTRASGPFMHVQMHMELDPGQTLSATHEVVEAAEDRILAVYPDCDLIIHADPHGLSEEHDREYDLHLGARSPRDGRAQG